MKSLLTVTALVEGFTGLALAATPSFLADILLGVSLTDPTAIIFGRLAGGALITIAFACWLSRTNSQPDIMVKVMLGYNFFATILLIYAALIQNFSGFGLWPAVLVHIGLLVWSVLCLWKPVAKFT